MLQQRAAGLGRGHALPPAHQQRGAERLLHVADARRGCGEREMRALGAAGDAAGLHHVAEQAEIGQIETHGWPSYFTKEATQNIYCPPSPKNAYSHPTKPGSLQTAGLRQIAAGLRIG